MVRTTLRTVAAVSLAALFTSSAATASFAATGEGVNIPVPIESESGRYIVLLDEAPVATYEGGEAGLAPTKPDEGERLDVQSRAVTDYSGFLEQRQEEIASEVGATPDASYQTTLNGFAAQLSADQAGKLAAKKGVLGVFPDEIRHVDAVPSTEFLGLEGAGGVWDKVGGIDAAGEGVVVGIVDTGIAPENPSFAGDALGTSAGDQPYRDGDEVVFTKGDGGEFRSTVVDQGAGTKDAWDPSLLNTKLIAAHYFGDGAAANGFSFADDHLSPRDGDGHGSHTASTAAGNNGVEASVEGVDFGSISGVAPAAKVASYKACYVGPDPLVTTDDICALSDLLAAIDQAVADGVDVINYSIGGGSATTVLAPEDISFFNAAAAGVFVATSAGNSGPDPVTADHASPWYATVAASTIPTWEGTVRLGEEGDTSAAQFAGASVSVGFGDTISGPSVFAGDAGLAGAETPNLCLLGSLDPAKVTGKIVVCDRGSNARVEKSQAVEEAGGIGMILTNVTPASLDNDFHTVPTVHVADTARAAVLEYVQGGTDRVVTLIGENVTGIETPVPQVAGFSSRGPMLADGSDVIKPDITAPGVAILAATENGIDEDPTFGILSGTSMSSPHVAGLAALYLGEHPQATPAEVKSAMMTTAYDTVDAAGDAVTDPFTQGAGHTDPTKYFEPGLLYLNGPADWAAYLQGLGLRDFGVDPIDPSDLNLPSIGVGALGAPQTVTRTITATEAGTYEAQASVPGVDVQVSPSSVTLAAGESATVEITLSRVDAPMGEWATGFLTWTGGANDVRSPIAVFPVPVDAPATVSGTGTTGSVDVTVAPSLTGEIDLGLSGLVPQELRVNPDFPEVPGHSGDQDSFYDEGEAGFNTYEIVDVPEGTEYARFAVETEATETTDLDMTVYRVVSPDDLRYYEQWSSATASANEAVSLTAPTAGTYLVKVNRFSFSEPFTYDLTTAVVAAGASGGEFTATPDPLPTVQGEKATYTLSWAGLEPETSYLGVVRYGDSSIRTVVEVESGQAAPVAVVAPEVTGKAKVGSTLKATAGEWDPAEVTVAYQWLRGGEPIEGATSASYKVTRADAGTALSVRVTATAEGNPQAGTAVSNEVFVKFASATTVSLNRYVGTASQPYVVSVKVTPTGGAPATGTVDVWVNSTRYSADVVDGTARVELPRQSRGLKVVVATYGGSDSVEGSVGLSGFLVLW